MKNNVVVMVPVRSGSKRVPDKNIRQFGNTSLLQLKLQILTHLNGIKQIVVSTDCEKAAEIGHKLGATIQWREKYYTSSEITNDLHWQHIAETTPGDTVFLAQVTSPLLRLRSMQAALDKFVKLEGKDSLNSVSVEKKFFWKNEEPINYDVNVTPKSQDLPNIVSLNFAITIIAKRIMIKRKNVVGYKPMFFELDKVEALDVDDYNDFRIAEVMFQELGIKWLLN